MTHVCNDDNCRVAEAVVRAIGSKWPVRMGLLPYVPEIVQSVEQKGTASHGMHAR